MSKIVQLSLIVILFIATAYFTALTVYKTSFHSYSKTVYTPGSCDGSGANCSLIQIEGTNQNYRGTNYKLDNNTNLIVVPVLLILFIVAVLTIGVTGHPPLDTKSLVSIISIWLAFIVIFFLLFNSYGERKSKQLVADGQPTMAYTDCSHYLYFLGSPTDTCYKLNEYESALKQAIPGL